MERYATSLRFGLEEVEFRQIHGSYFRPPSALRWALPMYWGRPALHYEEAEGCDIVHVTDHALAHHVRLFRARPTITTCHDLIPIRLAGVWKLSPPARLRRLLYLRSTEALRCASPLIAVSEATKRDMVEILNIDPAIIDVVPVAIPDEFAPMEDAEASLVAAGIHLPPGPKVLSIGHTGASKNLSLLFAALANPALSGVSIVRAGRRLPPELRDEVARRGLEGRVLELGHVPACGASRALQRLRCPCSAQLARRLRHTGRRSAGVWTAGRLQRRRRTPRGWRRGSIHRPAEGHPRSAVYPADAARFAAALAEVIGDPAAAARMRALGFEHVKQFRPDAIGPRLMAAYSRAVQRFAIRLIPAVPWRAAAR